MTLPDKVLVCMSPADRKRLGKAGMTSDEAQAQIEARSERELQRQINNLLCLHDFIFNWSRSDKRTTCKLGWPDYTVFHGSKVLFMEIKFGKGKLSPEQTALHARLATQGFQVHIVTTFNQAHQLITEALSGGGK